MAKKKNLKIKIGDEFRLYKTGPISKVTAVYPDKVDFETIVNGMHSPIVGNCSIDMYKEYKRDDK